jgi:ferredoxin
MSVLITFEQDGGSGLVAAGATVWDAAKRLGVPLRADCKGLGECHGCTVQIVAGADALSPATESELKTLGAERLLAGERLACQAILTTQSAVTLRVIPPPDNDRKQPTTQPFKQQVGAFIENEAKSISDAMNKIRDKSNALVEKFLNLNQEKKSTKDSRRDV